jgi:hypothetical protein
LIKQVGGVQIIAVFIYLLLLVPVLYGVKRIIPSFLAFIQYGVGFSIPVVVVAFIFHRYGILSDWIFWNLTYPSRYISAGAASQSFLSQIIAEFIPFVLATVILWILSFMWIKHIAKNLPDKKSMLDEPFSLYIILWFIFSMLVVFLGKRMFGHYFIQIIPSIALMASLWAGKLLDESSARSRKNWRRVAVALTMVPGIVFMGMAISFDASTDTWGEIKPDFRPAAEYIKSHTGPDDKIFVWGWFTPIYVYSERTPAARFVNTHMHTGYIKGNDPNESDRADIAWQIVPEAWPMLENDLNRNHPELIIDTSPGNYHDYGRYPVKNYPMMREFIDRNCRFEKNVAGLDIYRCQ